MTRLRLNQDLRNKISSRWRVHAEQEETDEKEKYFQARESIKPEQDSAWDLTIPVEITLNDATGIESSTVQFRHKNPSRWK